MKSMLMYIAQVKGREMSHQKGVMYVHGVFVQSADRGMTRKK